MTDNNIPTINIKLFEWLNLTLSINIEVRITKIIKLNGNDISLFMYKSMSETAIPTDLKSSFCFINSKIFKDSKLENREFIFTKSKFVLNFTFVKFSLDPFWSNTITSFNIQILSEIIACLLIIFLSVWKLLSNVGMITQKREKLLSH